jgi:hypothetical protein
MVGWGKSPRPTRKGGVFDRAEAGQIGPERRGRSPHESYSESLTKIFAEDFRDSKARRPAAASSALADPTSQQESEPPREERRSAPGLETKPGRHIRAFRNWCRRNGKDPDLEPEASFAAYAASQRKGAILRALRDVVSWRRACGKEFDRTHPLILGALAGSDNHIPGETLLSLLRFASRRRGPCADRDRALLHLRVFTDLTLADMQTIRTGDCSNLRGDGPVMIRSSDGRLIVVPKMPEQLGEVCAASAVRKWITPLQYSDCFLFPPPRQAVAPRSITARGLHQIIVRIIAAWGEQRINPDRLRDRENYARILDMRAGDVRPLPAERVREEPRRPSQQAMLKF